MSYDLEIAVKVDGTDLYAMIDRPEYYSPTYNLRDMFVACMDWDYSQHVYYKCSEVINSIERGIRELRTHRDVYEQYNPPNGWGTIDTAVRALESLRVCIYENAEVIPIEHLYMRW